MGYGDLLSELNGALNCDEAEEGIYWSEPISDDCRGGNRDARDPRPEDYIISGIIHMFG